MAGHYANQSIHRPYGWTQASIVALAVTAVEDHDAEHARHHGVVARRLGRGEHIDHAGPLATDPGDRPLAGAPTAPNASRCSRVRYAKAHVVVTHATVPSGTSSSNAATSRTVSPGTTSGFSVRASAIAAAVRSIRPVSGHTQASNHRAEFGVVEVDRLTIEPDL